MTPRGGGFPSLSRILKSSPPQRGRGVSGRDRDSASGNTTSCYRWRDFSSASSWSGIRARCGRFPRAIARKGSRAVRLRDPMVFPSAVLYLYHRPTACTSVVNAPIWKSETDVRRKIERRWSDVSLPEFPPISADVSPLGSGPESGDLCSESPMEKRKRVEGARWISRSAARDE